MDFLMTLIDENHWSDLDNTNISMNTVDNKSNIYNDKDTDKESSISSLSIIKTKKDTKQLREERLLKLSAKKQMNSLNNHINSLEPMDIQPFDNTSLIDDNYIDLFNDDIEDVDITSNNTINNKKRRRKSSENPDAAIIALATDKHLKAMNIDPNSKEGKFQIRRIRNRMSAQLHRERKKELIDTLQETIKSKDTSLYLLNLELEKLKYENELLKEKLGITINLTDNSSIHSTSNSLTSVSNISSITIPSNLSDNRTDIDTNHNQSNDTINTQKIHENEVVNHEYRSLILLIVLTFLYFCFRSTHISSFSQSLFNPIDITSSNNPFWNVYDSTAGNNNDENNDNNHRKLLTLPYNNQAVYISTALTTSNDNLLDESNNQLTNVLSPIKYIDIKNTKQSKSLINPSHSMWKYQNKELTIFPHVVVNKQTNKKKQNLRSRNHSRSSRTIESNDLNIYDDDSYTLLSDNEKAIIASNYMNSYMNKYLSDDSITSISRILLTQGKTLLDPSLVYNMISPLTNPVATSPVTTSTSQVDSTIISKSINVVKPVDSEKAISTWLLKSENTINNNNNKPFIIQSNDDSKSNILVMLLPASSVRWGKSWSDSTENSMDWMLRSLNYTSAYDNTTYNHQRSDNHDNSNDFENMWVEIGCSIFKAQIVSNVSFPS